MFGVSRDLLAYHVRRYTRTDTLVETTTSFGNVSVLVLANHVVAKEAGGLGSCVGNNRFLFGEGERQMRAHPFFQMALNVFRFLLRSDIPQKKIVGVANVA